MKINNALLALTSLLLFSNAAAANDDAVVQKSIQIVSKQQSDEFDFIGLRDMASIESNVKTRLTKVLGMPARQAEDVRVSRIFNTTWIQVSVEGKTYITDHRARQWLGTDLSELFLFEDTAKRIVVGNDNRESLIDYAHLMMKMREISPVYPAFNSPAGRPQVIFAFVDPSCPRCREFHLTKMKEWRTLGITWVYIPFLISDKKKPRELAEYVYCAQDIDEVKKRIDDVYLKGPKDAEKLINSNDACGQKEKSVVTSILSAGFRHGLAGSPMFLTEEGEVYYGTPSLEMAVINKLTEKFKK